MASSDRCRERRSLLPSGFLLIPDSFVPMDPLTHTLVGASLAETRVGRVGLGTATCVIGANLPDIDAATYFLGGDLALGFRPRIAPACSRCPSDTASVAVHTVIPSPTCAGVLGIVRTIAL